VKTFTVFTELTKPSQSVVTIIGSVSADLVGFDLVIYLLQETTAGDAVSRSFRPNLPGNEYPTVNTKPPAPGQNSQEYGGLAGRGDSPIAVELHEPRFSSPNHTLTELQGKKPLVGSGRSNSRETKAGTSYGDWKPEQLSNGNYRQVSCLSFGSGPLPILGAIIPARTGITAGISGTLMFITPSDLLNRSQLSGRTEEPTTASQDKDDTGAQS